MVKQGLRKEGMNVWLEPVPPAPMDAGMSVVKEGTRGEGAGAGEEGAGESTAKRNHGGGESGEKGEGGDESSLPSLKRSRGRRPGGAGGAEGMGGLGEEGEGKT
jgi:hypothetical protein